jgi:hypothetical protein
MLPLNFPALGDTLLLFKGQVIDDLPPEHGLEPNVDNGREARIHHPQGRNKKSRLRPHPRATFSLPLPPPFSQVE